MDRIRKQAIDALLDKSGELEQLGEIRWPDDEEMQQMYKDDAYDMAELALLLREDTEANDRAAARKAANMDTAPREDIPEIAWPFLGLEPLR